LPPELLDVIEQVIEPLEPTEANQTEPAPQPAPEPIVPEAEEEHACLKLVDGTDTGYAQQCFGTQYRVCVLEFLKAGRAIQTGEKVIENGWSTTQLHKAYFSAALRCAGEASSAGIALPEKTVYHLGDYLEGVTPVTTAADLDRIISELEEMEA
ncbi:MAG: hypothetical protein JW834_03115, partial [Candidatus Diapherotrites archaeon]|nr:hypothetical protein [Candidatus Diapherotrites archaeon]